MSALETPTAPRPRASRLLPPPGLGRRLALQSAFYAVGSGVFLAGNAVFFTQVVGLSPAQVGVGISVAGLVSFLVSVPLGSLADRAGPLRTWALAALVEAAVYLSYPWIRGFAPFVAVVVVLAVAESAGSSGRGAYTLAAFPPGERVRALAYLRAALNIGFTVGALLAGVALGIGSHAALLAVPVVTGAVMLANAFFVSRLPGTPPEHPGAARPRGYAALRDRPFLVVSLLNGVVVSHGVLLTVTVPLFLVVSTDAPHALLAWLFALNTVIAVLLQVPAARGAESLTGAARATRRAGAVMLAGCALLMAAHWTGSLATVALLTAGYVALTAGELLQSAGAWGLMSELSPADRRAEYQGAFRLGTQLQAMVAPAAFTALAVTWSSGGWLVIGVLVLGAGAAMPYAAARAAAAGPAAEGAVAGGGRSGL